MRVIMVMFDTLSRRFLPPYGAEGIHAPNFTRLAERTVTFDTCYAGSMPCMPARREIHTGRYNFLHRSWGPMEPYDDSVPELLKKAGVHTHLVTDHQHYWEDGGATYHGRYSTYEFFRGQEGDAWKGHVADPEVPDTLNGNSPHQRQDWVNRTYLTDQADHPQTGVFDAGLHFIETNANQDRWFVQIEGFDPHEPFFSYDTHKAHYPSDYDGPHYDWPSYSRSSVVTDEQLAHVRNEYAALITMCDESLGRVLDAMDAHDLWADTMLIVNTDHGFLLGEHGWLAKTVQPWWDETIHTPLFIWDPRSGVRGERRDALVQTIDLGPTLLDFFGLEPTASMQGRPLTDVIRGDHPVRDAGLFGIFGGHACVTDGRYVYMRGPADPSNGPLLEHTLMPTHMRGFFQSSELRAAELVDPLPFTKGYPLLRTPGVSMADPWPFGTLLYDLETDPEQEQPLLDDELELSMAGLLLDAMRANDAPPSQFVRLGLPEVGPADRTHLLVARQWDQVVASSTPLPGRESFEQAGPSVFSPVADLLADPRTEPVVAPQWGHLAAYGMADRSPYEAAGFSARISAAMLHDLNAAIRAATDPREA